MGGNRPIIVDTGAMGLLASGLLRLSFTLCDELERVSELMKKYSNLPMSVADGCLVRMSEINNNSVVFTFDSDFQIYRRHGRERISTVPEV